MKLLPIVFLSLTCGVAVGTMLASVYLTYALGLEMLKLNVFLHLKSLWQGRWSALPYITGHLIVVGCFAAFLFLGLITLAWDKLVRYGERSFQSLSDLRRNQMLLPPGYGFVLGEQVTPPTAYPDRPLDVKTPKRGRRRNRNAERNMTYVCASYARVMNVLLVAPTRAGKGVSFVIPNALTFPGSMVVLDVKGELWEETARARVKAGDKVFRFAPFDFKNPSHQYNPLAKFAQIEDMEELWTALDRVAHLFLQSDGKGTADWLKGSTLLFVAAGILAVQRNKPTMGEIYRIIFGTGEGDDIGRSSADLLSAAAKECQYPPAARELSSKASLDPKIQQSYISVLSTAGLSQWANPKVERITQRSDFDFTEMRRTPTSVYLVVASDDIANLNSLIRLFFADLISFVRKNKPEADEKWPIFMLLDEFDQLGYMPLMVQAMKQTAGHGGRFAIVTQSIPGMLSIPYTPEEVKAIESACQVKLYISASEDITAAELETSLGTRTGATISRTRDVRQLGLGSGSITRGTEHRPLLSKQEIRDMDPNKIIILPERQDPILANRIEYFASPAIKAIYDAQDGVEYPMPAPDGSPKAMTMTQARQRAKNRTQKAGDDQSALKKKTEKERAPQSSAPLHKRARSKPKSTPTGPLSASNQAALEQIRADIEDVTIEGKESVAAE